MTRKKRKRREVAPRVAPAEGYVTVVEAAAAAGVSAPTVYYWVRLGQLPKVGGLDPVFKMERGAAGGGKIWILRAAAEAMRAGAAV